VAGILGTAAYLLRAASSVPGLPEKHVPHSEHKGGATTPSTSAPSTSETVECQAGDARDSRKILVERKHA
jgi:hypothetical protein